jgi:hypothetical protein
MPTLRGQRLGRRTRSPRADRAVHARHSGPARTYEWRAWPHDHNPAGVAQSGTVQRVVSPFAESLSMGCPREPTHKPRCARVPALAQTAKAQRGQPTSPRIPVPLRSPRAANRRSRAEAHRNNNPRVGGSSPSSGMRSACTQALSGGCWTRGMIPLLQTVDASNAALRRARVRRGVHSWPPGCPPRSRRAESRGTVTPAFQTVCARGMHDP